MTFLPILVIVSILVITTSTHFEFPLYIFCRVNHIRFVHSIAPNSSPTDRFEIRWRLKMPEITRVKVLAARCTGCGIEYTGEHALQLAMRCEKQGRPSFSWQLGVKVSKPQPGGRRTTYTVIIHVTGWYSHRPCYLMETQSGCRTVFNEDTLTYMSYL